MIRALWFGLLALAAFTAAPAAAAARLFSEDAPLTIVITGPFNELVRKAKTNKDPYPATLTVRDGGGPVETLKIQIRARGLFRRTSGSCAFPPIGLDFGKQAPKGSLFHGDGKLKLVGGPLQAEDFGFIFPKGSDLVAPVNAAIADLKADGTFDALNKKWFLDYKMGQ